jgi:murein L,D-transpeptidase YcbB/YkuD
MADLAGFVSAAVREFRGRTSCSRRPGAWPRRRLGGVALIVASLLGGRPVSAQLPTDSMATSAVRDALAAGRLPLARWPRLSDVALTLQQVYDSAAWRPLWHVDGYPTPTAISVVRNLLLIDAAGLRPDDYDATALDSLARRLGRDALPTLDSAEREGAAARFEATMSVAVARVLASLQWGRINPRDVHESFHIPHDDYDLPGTMLRMARGDDPTGIFNAAEPPFLHYRLLKAELSRQRQLARDSVSPAARTRMATRIAQVELSLERWRWLPHSFPGRVIIVNIPEFRLHAFDRLTADSTALFSMDVVVGAAYDHRTPVFIETLDRIAFSPYWEVPSSIARKEIKPKAVRSASYLARNHYVLLGSGDRVVPATSDNIAAIGRSVRVRQLPGPDNSLGRVKFLFPNVHNVYMHDTPVQSAFARERRDLSHGCIRLSDPLRLAAWILRDRPEWTTEAIDSATTRTTPLDVPVAEHIPILILYGTAIAERSGVMKFHRDIYGHDRRLAALLERGYPYHR